MTQLTDKARHLTHEDFDTAERDVLLHESTAQPSIEDELDTMVAELAEWMAEDLVTFRWEF